MSRLVKLLLALGVATVALACQQPTPTSPDKGNTSQSVTQIVNVGGASPSPAAGSCAGVNKIQIAPIASFIHGGSVQLSFTSFDAQGVPRSRACDQASTEAWAATAPCLIGSPGALNPSLTASASGSCLVSLDVDGATDAAPVTVQ
jgi:hypothetical protein